MTRTPLLQVGSARIRVPKHVRASSTMTVRHVHSSTLKTIQSIRTLRTGGENEKCERQPERELRMRPGRRWVYEKESKRWCQGGGGGGLTSAASLNGTPRRSSNVGLG